MSIFRFLRKEVLPATIQLDKELPDVTITAFALPIELPSGEISVSNALQHDIEQIIERANASISHCNRYLSVGLEHHSKRQIFINDLRQIRNKLANKIGMLSNLLYGVKYKSSLSAKDLYNQTRIEADTLVAQLQTLTAQLQKISKRMNRG